MFRYIKLTLTVITIYSVCSTQSCAQEISMPYSQIFSKALNGDVLSALDVLGQIDGDLSTEDLEFKKEYELRFKGEEDQSSYLSDEEAPLFELHSLFRDYWRMSLLNPGENYIGQLGRKVVPFLMQYYPPVRGTEVKRDSIGVYLSRYIHNQGLYTQEDVDVSGHLLDLIVWQSESDTTISFEMDNDEINIPIIKMKDFVTLGWREYATMGTHYPGGWATKEALYMVEKAYDEDTESFKVSFVAHEGRHHLDLNIFPDLENDHLEYRAKLTELSIADSTTFDLIEFFINNSGKDSEVPHFRANYKLIHQLSKKLFNTDFETDMDRWRKSGVSGINKVAYQILKNDTEVLKKNS